MDVMRAREATFRVGTRALVSGVDLALPEGKVTALLGPNGAGKSTLLKLLSGALTPSRGEIAFNGKPLASYAPKDIARLRAVLSQDSHLPFAFTVEEVALMGRYPHLRGSETPRDLEIAREALRAADMLDLRERLYPTLSGGERQRTQWARALAQLDADSGLQGKCLLLDEPTSSLDLAHQHALLARTQALARRGCAVLVILHDLNLAAQYSDRIVLMQAGSIAACGSPAEVLTRDLIRRVYRVESHVIARPESGVPWVMTGLAENFSLTPPAGDGPTHKETLMTTQTQEQAQGPALLERWNTLRQEDPKLRIRDAAQKLGSTEAQLLAASVDGARVTRLDSRFRELIAETPSLGRVMALTRNESVVHERKGRYEGVNTTGHAGIVLGPDIDMRIFFNAWATGFALQEEGPQGVKRSLQFFDAHGNAVHKIFALEDTDTAAFDALAARYRAAEQENVLEVAPLAATAAEKPDADIDVDGFRAGWDGLQDTHDFFPLVRRFGVSRTQALRLAGPERALPVSQGAARALLESASAWETPVMIFVGNPGNIQIHTGPVKNIKVMGPWLNVLDPDFNLHLREDRIATAWIVRKPTKDGTVTSLELFDGEGENIALFFGKRKPGQPEDTGWRARVQALEAAG